MIKAFRKDTKATRCKLKKIAFNENFFFQNGQKLKNKKHDKILYLKKLNKLVYFLKICESH